MFYETERIVRKQEKYVKSKAYDIIEDFKRRGLSDEESLACVELSIKNTNAEDISSDFLSMARKILINNHGAKNVHTIKESI